MTAVESLIGEPLLSYQSLHLGVLFRQKLDHVDLCRVEGTVVEPDACMDLVLDKGGGLLVFLVRVFIENRRVMALRVVAAVEEELADGL